MTIRWTHFPAGEGGFYRAPVLLEGENDAILIDGGFTLANGRAVASAIRATGKRLTTVYVSQSDPDYYFSLAPIHDAFPEAHVVAASATVAAIQKNVQKKIDTWGAKLGENGPRSVSEVVMPTPMDDRMLVLEGEEIAIVDAADLPNRRFLWVPSLRAVVGGVLVFAGVHVWTADTPTSQERAKWLANLDAMAARDPLVVVPGHAADGSRTGPSAIAYTREYLVRFEEEVARARDSSEVVAAMKRHYPLAGMGVALEIGAKVAKGEMAWG